MAEKKTAAPAAAEITPEIIEDWKKQYGDVFCVEAEGRKGYLRRPDRQIIAGKRPRRCGRAENQRNTSPKLLARRRQCAS